MTNKTQVNSFSGRIVLQNILLILLLVFLCLVGVWIYSLKQPPLYLASMQFSIGRDAGKLYESETKQEVAALLYSQAVYQELAQKFNQSGNVFSRDDFFKSAKVNQYTNVVTMEVSNADKGKAVDVLYTWFKAFQISLNASNQEKKTAAFENETTKRNSEIKTLLQNFRSSIENSQKNLLPQTEAAGLYGQLVTAIGNRIAYDAQIKALVKTYELKQSPLVLQFVAQNNEVAYLSAENDRLNAEIAHMKVQLGENSPQIKAMQAEVNTIYDQLQDKIYLVVDQIYSNAEIARNMEKNLREQVQQNNGDNSQTLNMLIEDFEQSLQNIWQNYQMMRADDFNVPKIVAVDDIKAINIERQSVFILYEDWFVWVGVAALLFFTLLVVLVGQFRHTKTTDFAAIPNDTSLSDTKNNKPAQNGKSKNNNQVFNSENKTLSNDNKVAHKTNKIIHSLDDILQIMQKKHDKAVLLAGEDAAKAAARLAMLLKKSDENILLVDISAKQIENLIGPHRGVTDVLTADARIIDVIYKDHDTGIDILPKGIASPIRAKEFEIDLIEIITLLQKDYRSIIFVMDVLPDFGLNQIVEMSQSLIICSNNEADRDVWQYNFFEFAKKPLYFLSLFG